MSCRTNGLKDQWAVGLMGCPLFWELESDVFSFQDQEYLSLPVSPIWLPFFFLSRNLSCRELPTTPDRHWVSIGCGRGLRDPCPPTHPPQPGHPVRIPEPVRGRRAALQTGPGRSGEDVGARPPWRGDDAQHSCPRIQVSFLNLIVICFDSMYFTLLSSLSNGLDLWHLIQNVLRIIFSMIFNFYALKK